MKNLFATKITGKKKDFSSDADGSVFRTKEIDMSDLGGNSVMEQIDAAERRFSLPLWMTVCMYLSGIAALTLIFAIITATVKKDGTFPPLPVFGAALLLAGIWFFFSVRQKKLNKLRNEYFSSQFGDQSVEKEMNEAVERSKKLLGVPDCAADIDILGYTYEEKNGRENIIHKSAYDYYLLPVWAFRENDMLCLATFDERYEIPLGSGNSAVVSFSKVGEQVRADGFTRKMDPGKLDGYGKDFMFRVPKDESFVTFAPYYSLGLDTNEGEFELLIAPWSRKAFSEATGIGECEKD